MRSAKQVEQELHRRVMRCSIEARGLWYVMRQIIDYESERPGHLQDGARPVFAEQLAHSAGCLAERASHWLGELLAAGVIDQSDEGVYFSPGLSRLAEVRGSSQRRAARSRSKGRVLRSALRAPDVAPPVAPVVAPFSAQPARHHPPPPSPLPPYTPIPVSPAPLFASGEASAAAAAFAAGGGGENGGGTAGSGTGAGKPAKPQAAPRKGKRVRTDAEHVGWRDFRRWFCESCWPKYHGGVVYDFDSDGRPQRRAINYQALWRFLDHDAIGFDLDRARKTAEYFAEFCADHHVCWDVPLQQLAKRADQYWQKSQLPRMSRVIGQPNSNSGIVLPAVDDYAIPEIRPRRAGGAAG